MVSLFKRYDRNEYSNGVRACDFSARGDSFRVESSHTLLMSLDTVLTESSLTTMATWVNLLAAVAVVAAVERAVLVTS